MKMWSKRILSFLLAMALAFGGVIVTQPTQSVAAASVETFDEWAAYYNDANFCLSSYSVKLFPTETFQLYVPSVGNVTYKSQNTKIATVNSKGIIKGVSVGATYIEVSCKYGTRYVYVQVVKNDGQYMDTVKKYQFPMTTKRTVTEYDRFILKIDKGMYVAPDLPKRIDAIMKAIEKHTGYSFYPGIKGKIPSEKKICFEGIMGYCVEPCGGPWGITVDDICLVGDEFADQLFCLVHELIHTVQYINTGYAGFFAEGYSETYVDEILKDLPYDYGNTEEHRFASYGMIYDDNFNIKDNELTKNNIEELFLKTRDDHSASYWLVKYIRKKYGDKKLQKIIKDIGAKNLGEDRKATFAYLKSVTSTKLFIEFYDWLKKQVVLSGKYTSVPIDYREKGETYVHNLEIINLKWTDEWSMENFGPQVIYENSIIFDWSRATSYMQQVQGKKIKGFFFKYFDEDNNIGEDASATFYDVNGKKIAKIPLNDLWSFEGYDCDQAVRVKIEDKGVHTANVSAIRSDLSFDIMKNRDTPQAKVVEKKHVHTTPKLVGKRSATYLENGYTGDSVCTKCNYVFEKGKSIAKLKLKTAAKVSVKSTKASALTVTWDKNSSATGYEIQYAIDSKFTKDLGKITIKDTKTISKTITNLKEGKQYYVRIRCYRNVKDAKGKTVKVTSSWVTKNVVAKLKTPTKVSAKSEKAAELTLTWAKNSNAIGYEIQYATDSKFTKNLEKVTIKKSATTSKTISKLTKGKTYNVRIRCYKTVKDSNGKEIVVRSEWVTKKVTIK